MSQTAGTAQVLEDFSAIAEEYFLAVPERLSPFMLYWLWIARRDADLAMLMIPGAGSVL